IGRVGRLWRLRDAHHDRRTGARAAGPSLMESYLASVRIATFRRCRLSHQLEFGFLRRARPRRLICRLNATNAVNFGHPDRGRCARRIAYFLDLCGRAQSLLADLTYSWPVHLLAARMA